MKTQTSIIVAGMLALTTSGAAAQSNPELEACRTTGLLALRERNPEVKDVSFDADSMTVVKANTKVEDTPVRMIVIGQGASDDERGPQATHPERAERLSGRAEGSEVMLWRRRKDSHAGVGRLPS